MKYNDRKLKQPSEERGKVRSRCREQEGRTALAPVGPGIGWFLWRAGLRAFSISLDNICIENCKVKAVKAVKAEGTQVRLALISTKH